MRRAVIGYVIVAGAMLLLAWASYHLMRTGSCASGGVYVSARPCPAGTGGHILGLMGGIFLAIAGTFVAGSAALGVFCFGMLFNLLGGAALLVSLGPAAPPDDGSGGIVMGVLFVGLMGIPPVLGALRMASGGALPRTRR